MRLTILPFLFLIHIIITVNCGNGKKERILLFSQILTRHGARAPLRAPYPNDPYQNESYWANGWGGLTELGKQGQYELGTYLRKRYSDFLSQSFSSREVHVISSDYDRAIVSAQSLLSGLYHRSNNSEGKWNLFPVHTIPPEYDSLLQPKIANSQIKNVYKCPKYSQLVKDAFDSKIVDEYTENHMELMEFLRRNSGMPMTRLTAAASFIGALLTEELHGMTLAPWAKLTISTPETLKTLAFVFKMLTYTDEMKCLSAGPLLHEFIRNMQNKINESETRKMYIYSGHDLILGNVMDTLGIYEPHWINFSSAIILDLYAELDSTRNNQTEYTVQVSYRNTSNADAYSMKIPGCANESCTLEKFIELVEPFIPKDLEKECRQGGLGIPSHTVRAGGTAEKFALVQCLTIIISAIGSIMVT